MNISFCNNCVCQCVYICTTDITYSLNIYISIKKYDQKETWLFQGLDFVNAAFEYLDPGMVIIMMTITESLQSEAEVS